MSDLTIEQMRQIVDNAPDWAKGYNTAIQKYTRSVWFSKDILLSDLKAKIDQHYYGQSEEKELEQYAILRQEKIEGGAVLVGGSNIQMMGETMSEFEKWFADQDFYTNMRFIHGDALFAKDGDVYRVLPVQMTHVAWAEKQSEIDQLKAEKAGLEKTIQDALDKVFTCRVIGADRIHTCDVVEKALRGES